MGTEAVLRLPGPSALELQITNQIHFSAVYGAVDSVTRRRHHVPLANANNMMAMS